MKKSKIAKSQTSVTEEVYYPTVIPDKSDELDRISREMQIRDRDKREAEKKHKELLRQQRIVNTTENKYLHTINLLLDRAEQKKIKNTIDSNSTGTGFSVKWEFFNFEDNNMLKNFLNELKSKGCFDWQVNPFMPAHVAEFIFTNVNSEALSKEKVTKEVIRFVPGEIVLYNKGVVYFKQGDGLPASIDFSTAPCEQKTVDALMELRAEKLGQTSFTPKDILDKYSKLHKKPITLRDIAISISNIQKRVRIKALESRFNIGYDKKTKTRVFQLS